MSIYHTMPSVDSFLLKKTNLQSLQFLYSHVQPVLLIDQEGPVGLGGGEEIVPEPLLHWERGVRLHYELELPSILDEYEIQL